MISSVGACSIIFAALHSATQRHAAGAAATLRTGRHE